MLGPGGSALRSLDSLWTGKGPLFYLGSRSSWVLAALASVRVLGVGLVPVGVEGDEVATQVNRVGGLMKEPWRLLSLELVLAIQLMSEGGGPRGRKFLFSS